MHHPVVDLDRALVSRDRQDVALRAVVLDELAVVEGGQDVAVHDHERAVQTFDEPKRGSCAQRFLLADIRDLHVSVLAVLENGFDEVREVADAEVDVDDAGLAQLADDDFEDRSARRPASAASAGSTCTAPGACRGHPRARLSSSGSNRSPPQRGSAGAGGLPTVRRREWPSGGLPLDSNDVSGDVRTGVPGGATAEPPGVAVDCDFDVGSRPRGGSTRESSDPLRTSAGPRTSGPSASSAAGCCSVVADAVARVEDLVLPSERELGEPRDARLNGENRFVGVPVLTRRSLDLRAAVRPGSSRPCRTFQSWGSSSSFVLARKAPTRVKRSSFA